MRKPMLSPITAPTNTTTMISGADSSPIALSEAAPMIRVSIGRTRPIPIEFSPTANANRTRYTHGPCRSPSIALPSSHRGADSTVMDRSGAPELPESPDAALARLVEGNERFRDGLARKPRQGTVRRMQTVESQQPFAAILACADSRVAPEVVFDQGLGDLFVVRVAGNTASDGSIVGSLEFAVEMLGAIVLLVLGHSDCGAVKGAIDVVREGVSLPGDIEAVTAPIVPGIRSLGEGEGDELLHAAVAANVAAVVASLSAVPIIRDRV